MHHNIGSLGPMKGTEGLEKAFKEFETSFNGLMTGSNELQTSFKVPKGGYQGPRTDSEQYDIAS